MAQRPRSPSTRKVGGAFGMSLGRKTGAAPSDSLRQQVTELGGARSVAEATGRSRSSVYRWLRGESKPRPDAGTKLDERVTEHRSTPSYRRSQVNSRRDARMRNHGARIRVKGVCGPVWDSDDSGIRRRTLTADLTGDSMREILDAYYSHGESAALDALSAAMQTDYMDGSGNGWAFSGGLAAVEGLDFERRPN